MRGYLFGFYDFSSTCPHYPNSLSDFFPSFWNLWPCFCRFWYVDNTWYLGTINAVLIDDGSLRVYYPSGCKVLKAIRGLGCEISSIVSISTDETELGAIWLASGRRVRVFEPFLHACTRNPRFQQILSFHMNSNKMILTLSDAAVTLDLDTDESDALNEVNQIFSSVCP
jgi:hypothetical protein